MLSQILEIVLIYPLFQEVIFALVLDVLSVAIDPRYKLIKSDWLNWA